MQQLIQKLLGPPFIAFVSTVIFLISLSACEYEFKDEPVRRESAELDASVDEGEVKESEPQRDQPREEPSVRPTLAPGKAYQGSSTIPAGAKKIDLLNLIATEAATVVTNAPGENIAPLFDGADDTLLRTPNINPLDTTITFAQPTKVKALRVRSTYSDFALAVQIDNGERLILDPIPEGDWGVVVLPTPVVAKRILIQTLRKVRDNYVHVNEIELY